MISEEQEAREGRPERLFPAVAAAALGKEKVTASPGAILLPLQVDSPAITALPTSHQFSPAAAQAPLVVAGAGAALGFSAVGLDRAGALLGGVDSARVLASFPGGGDGDGDGDGVGGAGLWSKSRRMLMALVGSSPAMWSARMMSISGMPSPSTARTMATCSSRSLPISPREAAAVPALLAPGPRKFPPKLQSRFAPPPIDFAGSCRAGPSCPRRSFFFFFLTAALCVGVGGWVCV